MRIEYAAPYWGQLALNMRVFVWMKRRYPQVLESDLVCNEQELAGFIESRGTKVSELIDIQCKTLEGVRAMAFDETDWDVKTGNTLLRDQAVRAQAINDCIDAIGLQPLPFDTLPAVPILAARLRELRDRTAPVAAAPSAPPMAMELAKHALAHVKAFESNVSYESFREIGLKVKTLAEQILAVPAAPPRAHATPTRPDDPPGIAESLTDGHRERAMSYATQMPPCPTCGSDRNVSLIAAVADAEAPVDVFECSACGLAFDEHGHAGRTAGTAATPPHVKGKFGPLGNLQGADHPWRK